MGLHKLKLCLSTILIFLSSCSLPQKNTEISPFHERQDISDHLSAHVMYLIQTKNTEHAIETYLKHHTDASKHNFDLLHQMAMTILEQGSQSKDPHDLLRTMFGVGIASNTQSIPILEKGLNSPSLQTQLASINFLSQLQDDLADELLLKALYSPFLFVRLEAAYHLASKKKGLEQISMLMHKIDEDLLPLFPKLFTMIGNADATKQIKLLLASNNSNICLSTILSIIEHHRDDFLSQIHILSTQHSSPQQEACALAFGAFKDSLSIQKLKNLSLSPVENVRIAAYKSLYLLGYHEYRKNLEETALKENLFAIDALADIDESIPSLRLLSKSTQIQTRINATMALLKHRDQNCLPGLMEILIRDIRDLAFLPQQSPGKGMSILKAIPSARENLRNNPYAFDISLNAREEILKQAFLLPEKYFLFIAEELFQAKQYDLIPNLVKLLENLQSSSAIALLKTYQQNPGSPLIRDYCNLALFRLKEPGPYRSNIIKWLHHHQNTELILFRPIIPRNLHTPTSSYELTPIETSRLLIETYSALAKNRDEKDIEALLHALNQATPKNRYTLAGLLSRAIE